MRLRHLLISSFSALALAAPALSQDANRPLSVIDWFSQHYGNATEAPPEKLQPFVPEQKLPPSVDVSVLADPTPDSVGLISPAVSGLSSNIWRHSTTEDLTHLLDDMAVPRVAALNVLLNRMMLAEAEGPFGKPGSFLLARSNMLTRLGAVSPAIALIDRAGPETNRDLFRLWADLKLLDGAEDELCNRLNANPMLLPDYDLRVFCLGRNGSWSAAATTLLGAEILGALPPDDVILLTRYLDPELFEDEPLITAPEQNATPLQFRIYESVGETLPTEHLPLAFANWDLKGLSGWKAQLSAGERLAVTGAVSENLLLGIYSANMPSASGGVWTRVAAIQELDDAISQADPELISQILPRAWELMGPEGLRSVLANLFADELVQIRFRDPKIERLVHDVGLMSRSYQFVAWNHVAKDPETSFLDAIASGTTAKTAFPGILPDAIRRGFAGEMSERTRVLLSQNRSGEALLSAITRITEGQDAPPRAISDAIALFEALGLTDTARQYALQLMLDHDPGE